MFEGLFSRLALLVFGLALVSGSYDFWMLTLSLLLVAAFILPDIW